MEKVVYKELSYEIMGTIFEVFKKLGYGFRGKDIMKKQLLRNSKTKRLVLKDK